MRALILLLSIGLSACVSLSRQGSTASPPPVETVAAVKKPPRIALALGGGAARGFAHVGVIKALEAQGIVPEIVIGTSAGSVVGALYASGISGFELQKMALQLDEAAVTDWSLPNRGVLKGEALENTINKLLANRPIEKFPKTFAAVAVNLRSGDAVLFRNGNAGMAVRASSAVPGVFQPMSISGQEYVDGGLVAPVPVRFAKGMGADFVIAVDISAKPQWGKTESAFDVLLQTFSIMGQTIGRFELADADIVIRPQTPEIKSTDFQGKHLAILEGEKAVAAILPALKAKLGR